MTDPLSINQLTNEIKEAYLLDAEHAESRIEQVLQKWTHDLTQSESLRFLEKLVAEFDTSSTGMPDNSNLDEDVMSRIVTLLLGKDVPRADFSSAEMMQRLADALNTLFNSLNKLISVINKTFLGEDSKEQTIRTIIGFHMEGEEHTASLESYIAQINKAFLTVQEAFKKAAQDKMGRILDQLDPDRISSEASSGFKIGPLKKAEYYEAYETEFRTLKKWFESGRFMEEFLRKFEKNCQNLSEY